MIASLDRMQNGDGSWSGTHCIIGPHLLHRRGTLDLDGRPHADPSLGPGDGVVFPLAMSSRWSPG